MVSRTEIAVMSDERKVPIGRITSKRSRGKEGGGREREKEGKQGRPDDGLITLHGRDSSSIEENFYEFQIHFPKRSFPALANAVSRLDTTLRNLERKIELDGIIYEKYV